MNLKRFSATALMLIALSGIGSVFAANAEQGNISLGDINGDGIVDATDASAILSAYANISTGKDSGLTAEQFEAADVNSDGIVDATDASNILAYYAYSSTGGTKDIESFLNPDEIIVFERDESDFNENGETEIAAIDLYNMYIANDSQKTAKTLSLFNPIVAKAEKEFDVVFVRSGKEKELFPIGIFTVDIMVNGETIYTIEFEVKGKYNPETTTAAGSTVTTTATTTTTAATTTTTAIVTEPPTEKPTEIDYYANYRWSLSYVYGIVDEDYDVFDAAYHKMLDITDGNALQSAKLAMYYTEAKIGWRGSFDDSIQRVDPAWRDTYVDNDALVIIGDLSRELEEKTGIYREFVNPPANGTPYAVWVLRGVDANGNPVYMDWEATGDANFTVGT